MASRTEEWFRFQYVDCQEVLQGQGQVCGEVREMAKDYIDVEVVWLTDSKDKKCLGGAVWTKLITGFVRLDKWMMRALKKRSGRLNTDEPMKTEEEKLQERRMVQFSQRGILWVAPSFGSKLN